MKISNLIKNQFELARYIGRNDFDGAIKLLDESLTNTAEDIPSLEMIAQCHHWAKRDENAIATAKLVLAYDTKNFATAQLLSTIYANCNEHKLGVDYARLALENYPKPLPPLPEYLFSLLRLASWVFPKLKTVHLRGRIQLIDATVCRYRSAGVS
jgi:tetratricopeptide (TPR) repeat protein